MIKEQKRKQKEKKLLAMLHFVECLSRNIVMPRWSIWDRIFHRQEIREKEREIYEDKEKQYLKDYQ